MDNAKSELKENIEDTKNELQNSISELENDINNNVNTKLTQLQQKDTELQNSINTVKTNLQQQITSNDTDIKNLQNKDTQLQQQITNITDNLGIVSIKKYNKNGYDWKETTYTDGSTYLEGFGELVKEHTQITLPVEVLHNNMSVVVNPPYYCEYVYKKTEVTLNILPNLSSINPMPNKFFHIVGKVGKNDIFEINKYYNTNKIFNNTFFMAGNYRMEAKGVLTPNGNISAEIYVTGEGIDKRAISNSGELNTNTFTLENPTFLKIQIFISDEGGMDGYKASVILKEI